MPRTLRLSLVVVALASLAAPAACTPEASLRELANQPTCSADGDCCVVYEGCHATSYVVSAKDKARADELVAQAATMGPCVRCITLLVHAACVDGLCVGRELQPEEAQGLSQTCGSVDLPDDAAQPDASSPTVAGCGAGGG